MTLSRPLRFDYIFATARAAIRDGAIGTARAVHAGWTFTVDAERPATPVLVALATELVDVALWLLDDAPSIVYATICGVEGPPLIQANLQTRNGSVAILEATLASRGLPLQRELVIHGADGSIYHRTTQDDLLWTMDGVEVMGYAPDAQAPEVAALTSEIPGEAHGPADRYNLAIARALTESLASGRPAAVVNGES